MTKIRSSIALVVGCVWALGLGGAALAADMSMPLKAPPPPAPPPLDIHGFVEWDWESFLINPQGQALINHGTGTVVAGLDWVLYKNKAGFINKITTGGGVAADLSDNFPGYWGTFQPSANGDLFDTVLFIDASVTFGQYWTLSDTFYNVYSGDVACNATGSCAGRRRDRCGLGRHDRLRLPELQRVENRSEQLVHRLADHVQSLRDLVLRVQRPEQRTNAGLLLLRERQRGLHHRYDPDREREAVGHAVADSEGADLRDRRSDELLDGNPTLFGVASSGGVGVFTTGLTFVAGLTWIPSNLGSWYAKAGFQYYDVINNALIASNQVSICGVGTTAPTGRPRTSSSASPASASASDRLRSNPSWHDQAELLNSRARVRKDPRSCFCGGYVPRWRLATSPPQGRLRCRIIAIAGVALSLRQFRPTRNSRAGMLLGGPSGHEGRTNLNRRNLTPP